MNHPSGCPAFATSVIEVKDGSGHGTAAIKITSTENDPYLRDAPAVKIIIVRDQWGHRYMMDKFLLGLVPLTNLWRFYLRISLLTYNRMLIKEVLVSKEECSQEDRSVINDVVSSLWRFVCCSGINRLDLADSGTLLVKLFQVTNIEH